MLLIQIHIQKLVLIDAKITKRFVQISHPLIDPILKVHLDLNIFWGKEVFSSKCLNLVPHISKNLTESVIFPNCTKIK